MPHTLSITYSCESFCWGNPWKGLTAKGFLLTTQVGAKVLPEAGPGSISMSITCPQPRPFLLVFERPTFTQFWILALSSISDFVNRVCFHLPFPQIIILRFYIYDQLFKIPLEHLTTAQLSITAIIIYLLVFREQHGLGNENTAFGIEQLCLGGVSPLAVNVLHWSIFLSICSPAILQVTVNKTSNITAKGLLLFPIHQLSITCAKGIGIRTPKQNLQPRGPEESQEET